MLPNGTLYYYVSDGGELRWAGAAAESNRIKPFCAHEPPRLSRVNPEGLLASTMLAFLATAGLFYVNIMAALVDGLVTGLHFTNAEAGNVSSANVYGAASGALIAVFAVKYLRWRAAALALLIALIAIDLSSTQIHAAPLLTGVRFIHGSVRRPARRDQLFRDGAAAQSGSRLWRAARRAVRAGRPRCDVAAEARAGLRCGHPVPGAGCLQHRGAHHVHFHSGLFAARGECDGRIGCCEALLLCITDRGSSGCDVPVPGRQHGARRLYSRARAA